MRACGWARFGVWRSERIVAGRVKHAGRLEDMFGGKCFPASAGDCFDKLAGHHVKNVVVGKAAAETRRGLDVAQPLHRLRRG